MRGRIRTVKPEVFSDETLWDLELETGLPLLRVFIGLWCYCDREGRFIWSPRALRGAIAPCWAGDMAAALEALASKLYIVRYTVNGKDYGYVRTFKEHQAINKKEPPSILPPPFEHASTGSHVPGTDFHVPGTDPGTGSHVGKGREGNGYGKGMEEPFAEDEPPLEPSDATALHREPTAPRGSRKRPAVSLPEDFAPNDGARYLARTVSVDLERELPAFCDHHRARDSKFSDWQAALRTWIRNAAKWGAAPKSGMRGRSTEADERLQAQADRVRMLREQEADEERRGAAGGGA